METNQESPNKTPYPEFFNNLLEEVITTQAYLRALIVKTIPKEKLTDFEQEFDIQLTAIKEFYASKKK